MKPVYWFVCIFGCVAFGSVGATSFNDEVVAEVVWVSEARPHSSTTELSEYVINYRDYDGEVWRDSDTVLYSSENGLVTPSIFSLSSSEKMLVWSELFADRTSLMYKHFVGGEWKEAKLLSEVGVENLGASMATSLSGQLWVFWAAHQNDNDDIYQSRYDGRSWSLAKRVHAKNEVPDYAAQGILNGDGALEVRWKSYSPLLLSYDTASTTVEKPAKMTQLIALSDEQDARLSDIIAPDFLPINALHIVHFPQNQLLRNARINDN